MSMPSLLVEAPGQMPLVVARYDLDPVTRRLTKKGVQDAPRLEGEFRKLATLWALHPGVSLAPCNAVDSYWHEFILDTRRYRDFCARSFGVFVDHVPDEKGFGMKEEYAATLALYRKHFGEPDPAIWGEGPNSMSGPSQSGLA